MGRGKVDLLHEEELAEAVRKFPCLYDKRVLSYKDKRAKANACKKIEETLGMEEGNNYINNNCRLRIHPDHVSQ